MGGGKQMIRPYDILDGLEEVRLDKVPKGLGIGVESFDQYVQWKQGQFNMVNGHDNVGKTDTILWYFTNLARKHNKKFDLFSSENTYRSIYTKIFNFWTGKRLDRDFKGDEKGFKRVLNEITDCFNIIPNDKRYSAKQILDISTNTNADGLLIDPFNSLMTETGNKHQEDYDICADIRIFCTQTNKTTFVNAHLVTQAARNVFPKDHDYEGNLKPPEKADTEGGQKFANRADDFWTVHRMTQHPERWNITELHVRKVKETITGGSVTPRDTPIELKWEDHCKYFVGGVNPIQNYHEDRLGDNDLRDIGQEVTDAHARMRKQSYSIDDINDDLPF